MITQRRVSANKETVKKLITELHKKYSYEQIAIHVGKTAQTIMLWRSGKNAVDLANYGMLLEMYEKENKCV